MTTVSDVVPTGRPWPTIPPRLVATDLDNTLLGPDASVSPRTERALAAAAAAGIAVVFVSARPLRRLRELSAHVAGHGVAICSNGAAVFDVGTDCVLAQSGMTQAEVVRVVDLLRAAWGADEAKKWAKQGASAKGELAGHAPLFYKAQRKLERDHFRQRKALMLAEKERIQAQTEMGLDPYLDSAG